MAGNEQRFQQAMNQGHSAAWDQAWKEAAAFYKQALDEFPDHPKALTSLGLALYQLQDYKSALINYQKAAKLSPNDPFPMEKVAELSDLTGNMDQATEVRMRAADMYLQNRNPNKAIELWAKVVNQKPDHLMAHSRMALVYEKMGHKQQAVTEYLAVASILQSSGDIAKAVQTATRAQQVMPESNEPARALAMLQAGQRLPRPTRPTAVTAPLVMPQRPVEPAKSDTRPLDASGLDPIAETRQKALAALAGLLFEQEEGDAAEAQTSRRGLQAIVRGTGLLGGSQQIDQSKILLHISQAIDMQSHGDSGKVLEELERAVEAGLDHPAAHFDIGLLLWEADQLDTAIKHLQRALSHADYTLGVRLLLGQVYANMGKAQEASIEYLEALKLADSQVVSPDQAEALSHQYDPLIEAQTQQADTDPQVRLCNNVRELLMRPDWRDHLVRAREQLPVQTDGSPPIPLAEILTESRTSQVVDAISKINQLARAGHYRTAMEEAFYALQIAPTYLPLHISMADLLIRQERMQDAITKYKVVAQSYYIRGEAIRAIDTLRRIIGLSSMDMDARSRLIGLLVEQGQPENAINEYLRLADVYYSLADLPAARKACNQALPLTQQPSVNKSWRIKVLHRIADIDLQSLDWRKALKSFEQIRSLQPDDEQACTSLVDLNFRLGQEAQGLKELDHYISTLAQGGQMEKAIKFAENLVNENPKQPAVRRRLAELYRQAGRTREAIEQLDSAGEMLLEAGDKKNATEVIMAILALNPPKATEYQKLLAQIQKK